MLKKETVVYVACGILFVILVALLLFEVRNPEGGAAFIAGLFGGASAN